MTKVAIVGGGPGGLIAAYRLEQKTPEPLEIHLFEASDRLGGKIISKRFNHVPLLYEAGMAELYSYYHLKQDPLRQLVERLGLSTIELSGEIIIFRDKLLRTCWELEEYFGSEAGESLEEFDEKAIGLMSPEDYSQSINPERSDNPLLTCSFQSILEQISNPIARQFVKIMSHSDLATEPHLSNGLYGIENWLVDDRQYMRLYAIAGGNERLPQALKNAIAANIHLNSPVVRVAGTPEGNYQIDVKHQGDIETHTFDAVIVALPVYWLPMIQWEDQNLAQAIQTHYAHYDKPAHYLRITLLFQTAFWREKLPDSYFTLDAFGGCCVYDETSRYDAGGYGILSWLLSGNDALVMNNFEDSILVEKALESLPSWLQPLRSPCLEGRVDRWIGTVNAQPGGFPVQPTLKRHQPAPETHPNLLMVGDYLYDSTLNGVMHSANFASDLLLKQLNFTPRPCDLNPVDDDDL
jgi:monoamine oxidase